MPNKSIPRRSEIEEALDLVVRESIAYLRSIDDRIVRTQGVADRIHPLPARLPETGSGATVALTEIIELAKTATVTTAGPRCFHFVIGGSTPAALGADWLCSVFDQMAYAWVASPLATELEVLSLEWLRDLFDLPREGGAIMTTGATMANFVGLASARQWWGEHHDTDIADQGMTGLPAVPVFSSGYIHASARKALSMLGLGRSTVTVCAKDHLGGLDIELLESQLRALKGAPAIVVANAGEVNTGAFDPIESLAELTDRYGAWMHVDGAFGLFARVTPATSHLAAGTERAQSVAVDGHKWLNVPYDCGFAFVRDLEVMGRAFAYTADYLPKAGDPRPNFGSLGPESSRRARSLAVYATLRAYGRAGYQSMVENHLGLAKHMARLVDQASDLALLAEPSLNIVCFRYDPGGLDEGKLNALNENLGEAILADGRVYAGTTLYDNKTALRPAIVNWRTRTEDVEFFVEVVRELAGQIQL